ncbi:hypothetical protein [Arenibacter troitsensis]|uniref:Uncharacterized protein n=1 Tax=Arenibacter troitsensis TaxID=188872 RepID=A0A1X7L2V7_9FLAO|nr:hypothetical protein [Arenibacter troitsensis]SMG48035.1 hypothetical protein SAMN03080602_03676 [Arenibacter troitsensis]
MSSTIEDILFDAHKQNKREELLTFLEKIRQRNPDKELADLYQMAYEKVINS